MIGTAVTAEAPAATPPLGGGWSATREQVRELEAQRDAALAEARKLRESLKLANEMRDQDSMALACLTLAANGWLDQVEHLGPESYGYSKALPLVIELWKRAN